MNLRLYFLTFLCSLTLVAFAQKKTVSGKVVDIEGAPLEMVIVNVVGTNVVAYTDLNGAYSVSYTHLTLPTNSRV